MLSGSICSKFYQFGYCDPCFTSLSVVGPDNENRDSYVEHWNSDQFSGDLSEQSRTSSPWCALMM